MPTNLPPEYFEIEKRYKEAKTPVEKIAGLEDLLASVPKHKGTDKLRADLKKRLSKLKTSAQKKKSMGTYDSPYRIEKEGAGQVVVIGAANTGKSSLVSELTNATPETAQFPYATWTPTPGMMIFEDIQIQLIDTPPLNEDFVDPEMIDLIRRCDLAVLLIDLQSGPLVQLERSLAVLEQNRVVPSQSKGRYEKYERLAFVDLMVVANRCESEEDRETLEIFHELTEQQWGVLPISIKTGFNLDRFKSALFQRLNIIRVYSKAPGKKADMKAPFVLPSGSTVQDLAKKVHKDFIENFKAARVWGKTVYDGQMAPRDHVLNDGDVVEIQT